MSSGGLDRLGVQRGPRPLASRKNSMGLVVAAYLRYRGSGESHEGARHLTATRLNGTEEEVQALLAAAYKREIQWPGLSQVWPR